MIRTAFLLFLALALSGQVDARNIPPTTTFKNFKAIEEWANKNSWGGSSVTTLNDSNHEIVIVRRSYTSGIQSCTLSVYVHGADCFIEAIRIRPYHGFWLDIQQKGDQVVVTNSETKKEVLRFSIQSIALQQFELSS